MKRYALTKITVLCLAFIFTLQLFSHDPDAWEANQSSYQPPEIVLKAINLKEGMIIGEIGAGRGSTHATPKEDLISQVKDAGYSFERVAAELQRDDIYIFKKL